MWSNLVFLLLVLTAGFGAAAIDSSEDLSTSDNPYQGCKHFIVGAGIGGVFAAHQLLNTSTFPARQICIFEANNRPGGRIFSLRDENGRLIADLGAASYISGGNNIIMDTITSAFGLHTICEYYLSDCEEGKYFATVRNTPLVNQNKGTKKSNKLPYNLLPDEEYSTSDEFDAQNPYNLLAAQYQGNLQWLANLGANPNNQQKIWRSMYRIYNWLYTNSVPGTDLNFANSDFRTALYDGSTGERIWFSDEWWSAINQAIDGGEFDATDFLFNGNKIGMFSSDLFGDDYLGGSKVYFSDADGNPIGYITPLEAMLNNFTAHGGRIFYDHQITSIHRPSPYNPNAASSDKFVLEGVRLVDGQREPFKVRGLSAMLNMGVQDINRLSRDSVMWTEAEFDFEYVLNSYGTTPALKGYLEYSEPWWIRLIDATNNGYTTSEPAHFIENQQSWSPTCSVDELKDASVECPAWTMFSYVDGNDYTSYWNSANVNRTSAPIWLEWNDVVTAPFLEDAHNELLNIYNDQLVAAGVDITTIPLPNRGVMGYWEGGWAWTKTNNLNGRQNRLMRKPLQPDGGEASPGDAVCLFNTDTGVKPGEAMSSLQAAIEALYLCYGLQLPGYSDEYYEYVISQVY